jgi:hypothetical protein
MMMLPQWLGLTLSIAAGLSISAILLTLWLAFKKAVLPKG